MTHSATSRQVVDFASETRFEAKSAVSGQASGSPITPEEIFQLQLEQRRHDEMYHPEIARLTVHHRLNHMALHFAKYAGRIADAVRTGSHSDVDRTLVDIFIIALSSANILNVRLGDAVYAEAGDIPNPREGVLVIDNSIVEFLAEVTSASGKMAKACESIDHLEAVPFREELTSAVVALARCVLNRVPAQSLDLLSAVHERLESVRKTKIFHGHL